MNPKVKGAEFPISSLDEVHLSDTPSSSGVPEIKARLGEGALDLWRVVFTFHYHAIYPLYSVH